MPRKGWNDLTTTARRTLEAKGWKSSGVLMKYGGKFKSLYSVKRSLWRSGFTARENKDNSMWRETERRAWRRTFIVFQLCDYKAARALGRKRTECLPKELRGTVILYGTDKERVEYKIKLDSAMWDYWLEHIEDQYETQKTVMPNYDSREVDQETIDADIKAGVTKQRRGYFEYYEDNAEEPEWKEEDKNID